MKANRVKEGLSRISWYLFLFFIFALPSSNLSVFDGLPFSGRLEFAGVLLLFTPFIFPSVWTACDEIWSRLRLSKYLLWSLAGVFLAAKLLLLASGTFSGFSSCYASPAEPTGSYRGPALDLPCERSYENPFGIFPGTKIEESIRYKAGETTPIFFNTKRYDFYDWQPGNTMRSRMPVGITWQGTIRLSRPGTIRIEYAGSAEISVGDQTWTPAEMYDTLGEWVSPELAVGEFPLTVRYFFNDGLKSGLDPKAYGPAPQINVVLPSDALLAPAGWAAVGWFADAVGILLLLLVFVGVLSALWPDVVVLGGGLFLLGVFYFLPFKPLLREGLISFEILVFFSWAVFVRRIGSVSVYVFLVVAGFVMTKIWYSGWNPVTLLSAGNDPLGYASDAYFILANGDLRSSESVFFMQPFFRYVKFLEHFLFGDSDLYHAGIQLSLYFGAVWRLCTASKEAIIGRGKKTLVWATGCALIALGGYYVSETIRAGLPEYVTWICILWAMPLLLGKVGAIEGVAGIALLSIAGITRTNQLPGLAVFMVIWALRLGFRRWKTILLGGMTALGILLLPLAHNLYYGHAWVLFIDSAPMTYNMVLSPADWLMFFRGDAAVAPAVWNQISMLFLVSAQPLSNLPTMVCLGACGLCWAAALVWAMLRRRIELILFLLAPLTFLAPHLFWVVNTYYPRHIAVGYIAMAAAAVIALRFVESKPAIRGSSGRIPMRPFPPAVE